MLNGALAKRVGRMAMIVRRGTIAAIGVLALTWASGSQAKRPFVRPMRCSARIARSVENR
jgi:hypothetical protein